MWIGHDITDYDEDFLERFTKGTLPLYDLWSIRPLENPKREMACGSSSDIERFAGVISEHAAGDFPKELLIVIGNKESTSPGNMQKTGRKYYKLRFDHFKGEEFGEPLDLSGLRPYPKTPEQMIPLGMHSAGQRPPMMGMGGISYQDIQGIVDKNVSDATRSIKAEYDEIAAKKEVDSIKRLAELEMRMELYKLELREKEVSDREKKLRDELDQLDERKAEGLGTVKEYTKTIAGGLLELGKTTLGLDEIEKKVKKSKAANKESEEDNLQGAAAGSFDEDGFEKTDKSKDEKEGFEQLLDIIKNLDQEQKYALLDQLMPDEEEEQDGHEQEQAEQVNNKREEEKAIVQNNELSDKEQTAEEETSSKQENTKP